MIDLKTSPGDENLYFKETQEKTPNFWIHSSRKGHVVISLTTPSQSLF